ncbi:L-serine ammonia-lyase, iron-sulfur-dependent, subunit alpha [Methanococcus maripaludis]|uniref:L-cysteine desulfidase n=2 Tax=Methanococcus maripaludis TaxID=39152 RepID=CYDE_METM7|nr:L-serine ammonia-lyase, iron-sulfur-dependent, subunit alpha [Methanococcus maripaludis]A6VH54.1 RecName: Full=L-cysteine desulfidase; AltName: Full=L-cysteine desulfhydrase [Methanococcus maripaludis C7]MBA2861435.1 L-cysteine desulfidase [Methanococcus maripaludis]
MDDSKRILITKVLKNEVTEALGCTEVGLIGYAISLCNISYPFSIEKIEVTLNNGSFKNAYAVGVPNTKKYGILPAVVGGLLGNSKNKLLIFNDIKYDQKLEDFIKKRLEVKVLDGPLYCGVKIKDTSGKFFESLIKDNHLNVVIPKIEKEKISLEITDFEKEEYKSLELTDFLNYLDEIPEEIINLVEKTIYTNKNLIKGDFLNYGNDILSNMVNKTTSACNTRMTGENMPAMSVAKSGNMGLMATLPIISYDNLTENNFEKLKKSLLLAMLVTIYSTYNSSYLSSMCGCVSKGGMGAVIGLCYYKNGKNLKKLNSAARAFTANLPGIICDGGKVGCALKLASGCFAAYSSLYVEISHENGIVGKNFKECVQNISKISKAMGDLDCDIVKIMSKKEM